jgi:hypothetical protein
MTTATVISLGRSRWTATFDHRQLDSLVRERTGGDMTIQSFMKVDHQQQIVFTIGINR